MLKAANWNNALCLNRTLPFKFLKIEDQQVVEPEFSITASEDIHLISDDARSMELPHRRFTIDTVRDVKGELFDASS